MIAQVFDQTGEPGEQTDEFKKFTEEALAEGRKHDGVEAILSLADPATGRLIHINVFRDQAAMDAFQAYSNAKIAEVEKITPGLKVATPDIYTEVIALL